MHYTTVKIPGFGPRAAQFLDIPIGDPFGGPAYGQKEKKGGLGKVLGVVAAVAAVATGYGAFALAKGFTAANIAAGAMMAGGVMQGVGTITGNKKLAKIGGYLSLAGGIGGSLVSVDGLTIGQEGFKSATSTGMEEAMKSVSDAFSSTAKQLGFGKDASAASELASTGGNLGLDSLPSSVSSATDAFGAGASPVMDIAGGASSSVNQTLGGSFGAQNTFGQVGSPSYGADLNLSGSNLLKTGGQAANGSLSVLPGSAPEASKGFIGGALDFMKTPGGGNLTGKVLEGMAGAYGSQDQAEQQQALIDQRIAEGNLNMDILKQQQTNMQFKYEHLDPNDPQFAQKKADANSRGVVVIPFGVNQNAGPVTTNPVQMQGSSMTVGA